MSEWVTKGYDLATELEVSARVLHSKADALDDVGNSYLAGIIREEACFIADAGKRTRFLVSNKVDSDFKAAQDGSANILNGILAGMDLAKKK
jgi:hypothetical protein